MRSRSTVSPKWRLRLQVSRTRCRRPPRCLRRPPTCSSRAACRPPPAQGGKGAAVSIRFDPSYLKTTSGILKVLECVNNVVGMICIMASSCSWCSNSNWFNFVASTGLTVTLLLLLLYFFHLVERLKFVPWLAIELLYGATWTLFYMIAALVVAVKGGRDDAWAAAGFFGFVGAILYAADCYNKYKSWRDGVPAQGEKQLGAMGMPPVSPSGANYAAY
ncbi:MARVEL domain-containing protein 1-like [Uloborus diversus]|uniref:MARVEL domain-containing protein 1-like n=1 Tax=Uloborus diversus TaxID=327109 RepID=UPI0024090920|nr:MARVEL domain-containing protein 1-like [Uloborus diversus]